MILGLDYLQIELVALSFVLEKAFDFKGLIISCALFTNSTVWLFWSYELFQPCVILR